MEAMADKAVMLPSLREFKHRTGVGGFQQKEFREMLSRPTFSVTWAQRLSSGPVKAQNNTRYVVCDPAEVKMALLTLPQGVPGYWIAAYRTLTAVCSSFFVSYANSHADTAKSMIQDLKADSANWQRERGQSGGTMAAG